MKQKCQQQVQDDLQKSLSKSQPQDQLELNGLYKSIAKCFSRPNPPQNRLIFFTRSLDVCKALAKSFIQDGQADGKKYNQITILIDFQFDEIDQINYWMEFLVLSRPRKSQLGRQEPLIVKRIHDLTIDKRKTQYLRAGIYALTSQIFLTDLLRGQAISIKYITKLIIKSNQKIKDQYNYLAWLATHIKIQQKNDNDAWGCPLFYLSRNPHYYSEESQLQRIYRMLFCKRVVVWPFGRSQIHSRLLQYRKSCAIKEVEHCLNLSESEAAIGDTLMSLFNFLKKTYVSKYGRQMGVDQILYSSPVEQINEMQLRSRQMEQFYSIRYLLMLLVNCNKLMMLQTINSFIESNECQVWNSNNSSILQLTNNLITKLQQGIFYFSKNKREINLKQLLNKSCEGDDSQKTTNFEPERQEDYICFYELDYQLHLNFQQNEKINQLIGLIERMSQADDKVGEAQVIQQTQRDPELQQINKVLKIADQFNQQTVLVCAQNKRISKYIHQKLNQHINKSSYQQQVREVYSLLISNRPVRLSTIKKIYDKLKIKIDQAQKNVSENTNRGKKSKKNSQQIFEQNKFILQQIYFNELQDLFLLMNEYEIHYRIEQEKRKIATNIQVIYEIEEEQFRLKKEFNKLLQEKVFLFVDKKKISFQPNYRPGSDLIIQVPKKGSKLRIVTACFKSTCSNTQFNQYLRMLNPEVIIFYSPNTSLLRNLYIYQIEHESVVNLSKIHIFSYKNSFQTKSVLNQVTKQDRAFWNLSQNRSKLHNFNESPFLRVSSLSMRDQVEESKTALRGRNFLSSQGEKGINLRQIDLSGYGRTILVDTREFKSSLPSYLYHSGFTVIPVFLETSDYILSDDTAVQKKSVHTRDLHNSLKSGRLFQQMQRMTAQFKNSYILIECEQLTDCRKYNFASLDTGNKAGKSKSQLRRQLLKLVNRFPTIRLIWSTGVAKTCNFFKELKRNKGEPDIAKYRKSEQKDANKRVKSNSQQSRKEELQKIGQQFQQQNSNT